MNIRVLGGAVLVFACLVAAAFLLSPWPSVLIIRAVFDSQARKASDALASKVPTDVRVKADVSYDSNDRDALLDVYRGDGTAATAPTIVWFHGGGFISGQRSDIQNYLKILAGRKFAVVNVNYTIAPEANYPTPIRQANQALAFLRAHAAELGVNADKLVLAGDSAGAQIAAQTVAMIANPEYSDRLKIRPGVPAKSVAGAMLHCGVYDITGLGKGGGVLGWFIKSTTWAYSGHRDWRQAPEFALMSIPPHITRAFPPAFISAGNADPLLPQSLSLAETMKGRRVVVTEHFFPADYEPALGHEYQFDLSTKAGAEALDESVRWLNSL